MQSDHRVRSLERAVIIQQCPVSRALVLLWNIAVLPRGPVRCSPAGPGARSLFLFSRDLSARTPGATIPPAPTLPPRVPDPARVPPNSSRAVASSAALVLLGAASAVLPRARRARRGLPARRVASRSSASVRAQRPAISRRASYAAGVTRTPRELRYVSRCKASAAIKWLVSYAAPLCCTAACVLVKRCVERSAVEFLVLHADSGSVIPVTRLTAAATDSAASTGSPPRQP